MAVIFNGADRLIEITDVADFSFDVEKDIYSRWKDWSLISDNSKFAPAFTQFSVFGGNPTVSGQAAPKYFFLTNYWRVFINNGNVVSIGLNLYTENFSTPYIVGAGSGVSDRNSDAVNVNEEDIKNQSYLNARVFINTFGLGETGTIYPLGTPPHPSSNFPDAYVLATTRKLTSYFLAGTLSFTMSDLIYNTDWVGASPIKAALVFSGQDPGLCTFDKLGITGTQVPTMRSSYNTCALGGPLNLIGFYGVADNCGFNGDISLYSGASSTILFNNCLSVVAGTGKPTVDCNGVSSNINFRSYRGGLRITNFTGGGNMSIDMEGRLELDASCTAGTIVVGGGIELVDNSGPGCTVVKDSTFTELISGGGSGVWTTQEKNDIIADTAIIKDQSEISAIHAVEKLKE